MKVPKTWNEQRTVSQPNYRFNKVAKCGRDAYVDTRDKVENIRLKLLAKMQNSKDVVTSKFAYDNVYEVWKFTYLPWSASLTYSRVKWMFQSGIVTLWRLWKVRVQTYNATVVAAQSNSVAIFKALSLSDTNILVVYYVHVVALSVVSLVFLIEEERHLFKFCKVVATRLLPLTVLITFLISCWIIIGSEIGLA